MTTARSPSALAALALVLFAPAAAGAQSTPAMPQNDLPALTSAYFDAVAHGDTDALAARTSPTFHVILPDGRRLTGNAYFRDAVAHNLIASPPSGTVKIRSTGITGSTATESVDTATYDYAFLGLGGQSLEHDFATHELTWVRAADGTWLLDEDHITSDRHNIG
jgi:hypothetical protein